VRRDHEPARDGVGDAAAVVAPDDVQAQVDARRAPGRGQHAAVVDVEHVGVHRDRGMPLRERRRVAPVRRGLLPVEHPRRGEQERPTADRDQPRAAVVCRAHGADHRRRRVAVPPGDDDGVRRLERLQPVLDVEREAARRGRERPGPLGRDGELVPPRHVQLGPVEPEHLDDDAELERRDPRRREGDDAMAAHMARS
jgi:hypothetical protein